ncbi:4-diphosphocytidyl-2-C-methyl-D-erythritol kinase [Rhodopirellula maiorica SM1]|uniref:4-diphosphocytidyl-2-C-methyl-D-erythritol kinase n=1 Tax=Rhodopirellula maiorica SM1 TaxID=1265738 RepID=M5R9I0_9BACT|nr:4-diphosphocytidyl-2C-methyl-D-erythritol kinase [Rhodopirellula maiorica]EMI16153.1 4-diphosphocytidyl-2-C-methyl-D-erythritol kinase [Rhodopirellula maiorica SM1]
MSSIAVTHPPAKLNLFLELMGKRDDGYHDIDTVMVAIDWRDQLRIQQSESPGVQLTVQWMPSLEIIASELGVDPDSDYGRSLLCIPDDSRNLVHRALTRFTEHFKLTTGFTCHLAKSIPAGAGMGGASSDAASALLCAATLSGIPHDHPDLGVLAAELGSDVPFFLGNSNATWTAARAQGRGERLTPVALSTRLNTVVLFPAQSLSTAKIYSESSISASPQPADAFIEALQTGELTSIASHMCNRLQEPASKIAPQIEEMLKSMWHHGLRGCQLTGSGSACFGLAESAIRASRLASQLRSQYSAVQQRGDGSHADRQTSPTARVVAASSVLVPAGIQVE